MNPRLRRRILLADEEPAVRLSLKAILEHNGFDVDTASTAADASAKLKSSQYHMVITDMKMERNDSGLQVIKTAKESQYNPAIAILTAFPVPGGEWIDNGAHCMLIKPMHTDVLLRQIEALLVQHEDRKQRRANPVENHSAA